MGMLESSSWLQLECFRHLLTIQWSFFRRAPNIYNIELFAFNILKYIKELGHCEELLMKT